VDENLEALGCSGIKFDEVSTECKKKTTALEQKDCYFNKCPASLMYTASSICASSINTITDKLEALYECATLGDLCTFASTGLKHSCTPRLAYIYGLMYPATCPMLHFVLDNMECNPQTKDACSASAKCSWNTKLKCGNTGGPASTEICEGKHETTLKASFGSQTLKQYKKCNEATTESACLKVAAEPIELSFVMRTGIAMGALATALIVL